MKARIALFCAALFLAPATLSADMHAEAAKKPSISATQTVKVVTVVEAVDYEAKTVTLKGPEGNTQTIKAENTPNLEEVQVGDHVNIEYVRKLSIEVFTNEGVEPGEGVMTASAVNTPDQAPGGMEMTTAVMTATVAEINLEANTFKLNMPGGDVQEFEAANPENLKLAEVGDLVVTTLTEAVAIYLAEVPAE
ncbi:MAG: hypothetical protein HKP16_04790 [Xanthomonadales bacterium]|nr:hypothetical protein [Xanthomonadales bacterium]